MTQDSDPVSKETFSSLWELTSIGNLDEAYNMYIIYTTHKVGTDTKGNNFSYSLLKSKYLRYFTNWKSKHGTKDPKWIPKNDHLLGIKDFIQEDIWKEEHKFINIATEYFFGSYDIEFYERKLKEFRSVEGSN